MGLIIQVLSYTFPFNPMLNSTRSRRSRDRMAFGL